MEFKALAQKLLGAFRPIWKKDMTALLKSEAVRTMISREVRKEVKYAMELMQVRPVAEIKQPTRTGKLLPPQVQEEEVLQESQQVSINVGGVKIPMDMSNFGEEAGAINDLDNKIDPDNPAVQELANKLINRDYSGIMKKTAQMEKSSRNTAMMQQGII